jgi:Rrf2 family protein
MILLASRSKPEAPQVVVQSREISKAEDISFKFLEHILLTLTKAGLLYSKVGTKGGYTLSRPANQINLGEIIRALDGRLEPIYCVNKDTSDFCPCPREARCGLRMVMSDVYDSISKILDHTTLEDVSNRVARTNEMLSGNQVHENTEAPLSQNVDFTI